MGKCKRSLKACASSLACLLPTLPAGVMDLYTQYKVGREGPAVAVVLYAAASGENTVISVDALPAVSEDRLRIVIISDTHERHRCVTLPKADVLFHCGDICNSSSIAVRSRGKRVLEDFNKWLAAAPCEEKVIIGGNHDTALELLGNAAGETLSAATAVLQDSAVTLPIAGLRVYGHGHSEGISNNRAYQRGPVCVSADACRGADVVLTHECSSSIKQKVMESAHPMLWASGHKHRQYGLHMVDGTLYANASIMDGHRCPLQAPIVVDLPRQSTKATSGLVDLFAQRKRS